MLHIFTQIPPDPLCNLPRHSSESFPCHAKNVSEIALTLPWCFGSLITKGIKAVISPHQISWWLLEGFQKHYGHQWRLDANCLINPSSDSMGHILPSSMLLPFVSFSNKLFILTVEMFQGPTTKCLHHLSSRRFKIHTNTSIYFQSHPSQVFSYGKNFPFFSFDST